MARKGVKNINSTKVAGLGTVFASRLEFERALELKAMEQQGLIRKLEFHPVFPLQRGAIAVREARCEKVRSYTADSTYLKLREEPATGGGNWIRVVEDVKGSRVAAIAYLRISIFKALYPEFLFNLHQIKKKRGNGRARK